MPVPVTMPQLGESVTEGTVTRWLKREGDHVEVDEPLLEVSTDKVDTEIPSPATGVLTKIMVAEDETAAVGSQLALITGDGEQTPAASGGAGQPAAGAEAGAPPAATNGAAPAQQPTSTGTPAEAATATDTPQPGQAAATPIPPRAERAMGEPVPSTPPATAPAGGGGVVVKMPVLGESVTEGTITRWLKQVGDQVTADEPLLEVSTDKVDTEIPAPESGTLLEIKVAEDETAPVGAELAVIGPAAPAQPAPAQPAPAPAQPAPAQPAPAPAQPAPAQPAPAPAQPAAAQPAPTPAQPSPAQPTPAPAPPAAAPAQPAAEPAAAIYVTPLVRKLAAEHNVDLASVRGTGVGGRIRKQDVLDAAERQRAAEARAAEPAPEVAAVAPPRERPTPSPLRGTTEKMTRLRSIIAKRMIESLQVSAQLTTVVEVDVTRIARLREQAKDDFAARHGVKLTFLPFFALATVEALQVHPKLNASIDGTDGTVTYHDAEHLGIAVDTDRGLLVPVIQNAGDLNLAGLAKRIADLAERTRTNKVTPDELAGGTFTLTNTGSRGALIDTPIINQPQVAILGTGAVVKRAAVIEDSQLGEVIVPRSMVYLSLTYDHRLVDGADAARFLATIKERLEEGNFAAELGLI